MANNKNLKPFTSNQSREEAKKNGSKGGKKSGEVRRQRQQLRQIAQDILTGSYTDPDGEQLTGEELIGKQLMEVLKDINHKHWFDVMQLLVKLTDSDKSESELALLEASQALSLHKVKQDEEDAAFTDKLLYGWDYEEG